MCPGEGGGCCRLGDQKQPELHADTGAGGELVHSPKSIPSDTLPRATDSRMAPRPFSQAWGGEAETGAACPRSRLLQALCTQSPGIPHVPTHLLVLLQGDTGLGPVLCLDEEQLVPLDVFENALGKDTRRVGLRVGRKWTKGTGILAKPSSAPAPVRQPCTFLQPSCGKLCDLRRVGGQPPHAILRTSGAAIWPEVAHWDTPTPAGG